MRSKIHFPSFYINFTLHNILLMELCVNIRGNYQYLMNKFVMHLLMLYATYTTVGYVGI